MKNTLLLVFALSPLSPFSPVQMLAEQSRELDHRTSVWMGTSSRPVLDWLSWTAQVSLNDINDYYLNDRASIENQPPIPSEGSPSPFIVAFVPGGECPSEEQNIFPDDRRYWNIGTREVETEISFETGGLLPSAPFGCKKENSGLCSGEIATIKDPPTHSLLIISALALALHAHRRRGRRQRPRKSPAAPCY
jgi:hypothetical protein